MMQAMKGATVALGSMNRTMNLPSLQRIAMEFERENDMMEQRQELMDDAIDDAMDVGVEEEGDEVVEQVLEEIGVDLSQSVRLPYLAMPFFFFYVNANVTPSSLARLHPGCRQRPYRSIRSHRPWAAPEATRAMTISRRDWTV